MILDKTNGFIDRDMLYFIETPKQMHLRVIRKTKDTIPQVFCVYKIDTRIEKELFIMMIMKDMQNHTKWRATLS